MTPPPQNPLARLVREIHRRSLWQVLGVYLVAGWIAFEVVQTLTEGLGLPEWFPPLAIVLLVIGLPIVLATAFIQEGGPRARSPELAGTTIEELYPRSSSSDASAGVPARLFTWRNALAGAGAAFVLLVGVAVGWLVFGERAETAGAGATGATAASAAAGEAVELERSIAVLPFENLSADPEQQYFSDGVADQILNALTRVPDLKVTARTSAFAFRNTDLDIRTIADTLGVATVLEGTVQRSGDRVRITAQLIEAESGFHLWSETYDRQLTDIFEVQDDVARRIAERLEAELGGAEERSLAGPSTDSPEAHDSYLRGRQLLYQRSPSGIRGAIGAFERSLEEDPEYAPAYVGLAEAYAFGQVYGAPPPGASYEWAGRALAYADRAVELGPMSGEAYAVRAVVPTIFPALWTAPRAPRERVERDYRRALELQPNSADALGWYAQTLSQLGRHDEALRMQEESLALDPVAPGRRVGYAVSALWAREYELALEQLRRARTIQPNLGGIATMFEMWSLLLLGRAEECLELDHALPSHEALCLHEVGRVTEARVRIDSLAVQWSPTGAWLDTDALFRYYAWNRSPEQALSWLERALEEWAAFPAGQMSPGLWNPLLSADEVLVRSTVTRLGEESWSRIIEERDGVGLP